MLSKQRKLHQRDDPQVISIILW